jgi:hypothetical protein
MRRMPRTVKKGGKIAKRAGGMEANTGKSVETGENFCLQDAVKKIKSTYRRGGG